MSVRAGFVPHEAKRLTRLAQRHGRVPTLMEHARRGKVSVGMCEVAARVATPENEAALAEIVRMATPSQAARVLAQYRRLTPPPTVDDSVEPDPADAEPTSDRDEREWWSACFDDDGMYRGSFCLSPLPDAIERLAMLALDQVHADAITAPGGERFAVQVAVDLEVLARIVGIALDPMVPTKIRLGERCHIVGGPTLSDAELSRILCDASVQVLVHDGGVPLWLGNEQRTANRHQRRALRFRDGGCAFPGCPQTRFVDAHHIEFHADGGATDPSNTVLLCGYHHRQVHRGDLTIVPLGRQRFEFVDRWGRTIGRPPDPHEGEHLAPLRAVPDAPPDIGPDTPRPIGRGEPLTAYGLDVLLHGLLDAA